MMQEFFGKPFRYTLLGFSALFALSIIGYFSYTSLFLLGILALVTLVATARKLEYGLAIAFLELLSNAHGYILFAHVGRFVLSARMTIFASVFIGWGIMILLQRSKIHLKDVRLIPFLPLALAIAIGGIVGLTRRSAMEVFSDGNAYLFLGYLIPVLHISWNSSKQRVIFQMLTAATVFTSVASLLILYAYTHFSEPVLKIAYVYLRDIRFAEITNVGMGFYRIFEQTQFFAIVFGLLILPRLFLEQTKRDRALTIGMLSLVVSVLLISMSRSFLFGFAGAVVVVLASLLFLYRTTIKRFAMGIGYSVLVGGFAGLLLLGAVVFPFPHDRGTADYLSGIFGARVSESDVAISSRWNLLNPMLQYIKESPVLGNGFGQAVTFKTDDPRARAIHPDGTWTTTSMEWGWFELWLKMGIMAPIGFLFLFVMIVRSAAMAFRSEKSWVSVWIVSVIVFLYFTHVFSPYLNHPIGLGTLVLLMIFLPKQKDGFSFAWVKIVKQKMPRAELAASVVTLEAE